MGESNKRKSGRDGPQNGRAFKKSKGGSEGRWKTPHQKAKYEHRLELGKEVEVGDAGIWVTFARGMTARAAKEIDLLCDEYGKKLFGVKHLEDEPKAVEGVDDEDEEDEDISAAIEREVAGLKQKKEAPKPKTERIFQIVRTKVDCVFFVRTRPPVKPIQLVRAICEDALATGDHRQRKSRYLNRLTPVTHTAKASESGIDKVAREALAPWFDLKNVPEPSAEPAAEKGTESSGAVDGQVADSSRPAEGGPEKPAFSYAIRQDIRQNRNLKSDALIHQIADLVDKRHKVNLDKPDKVICVEVYQNLCAVGVVDGSDWARMKKFNIAELYKQASEEAAAKKPETAGGSSDVNVDR